MNKRKYLYIIFSLTICIQFNSCSFRLAEELNYDWELTYEDNFDSFDRTKWINMHEMGNRTIWSNKELQWYKDENVVSENGILKLTVKKESIYGKDTESEKQFNFTSGMICGSRGFLQAYGKWEIRVKFPYRKGYWPAFWLLTKQNPGLPEIDIFEYFGREKDKINITQHWGINYRGDATGGQGEPFYYVKGKELSGDFSDKWMVWTFECMPNKMMWKLDDKVVYESSEGIPTAPLYMIVNVAVKDWAENNYVVDNSDSPYVMEIDYVKVYKMVPKK